MKTPLPGHRIASKGFTSAGGNRTLPQDAGKQVVVDMFTESGFEGLQQPL